MIIEPDSWRITEGWVADGSCRDQAPEIFFPPPGGDEQTPLGICRTCPVQESCLRHAIETGERWGVWGGTTQRYRRRLIRVGTRRVA